MLNAMTELAKNKAHPAAPVIACMGAIKAIGECLRVISNQSAAGVVEQNALAYLRGALRNSGGPVRDDGRPFTGALDG